MVFRNFGRRGRISSIATIFVAALAAWGCASVQSNSQSPQKQTVTVSIDPPTASIKTSTTQKFTVTVANTANTAVTWHVNGVAGGDAIHGIIDATGRYTAPAVVPSPATVTVAAVAVVNPAVSDVAQVTISASAPAIPVTLSPTTVSVQTGKTQNITATVQNDDNKGVTWTLTGAGCTATACGTLSANSSASGAAITYTAPAKVPTPAAVTLTATSVADPGKTAAGTITVTASTPAVAIAVTVSPTSATVQTGGTHSISATVQNDGQNKGVTWSLSGSGCSGSACGTLSATSSASGSSITYKAPGTAPSPATVTLTAKSVTDTSKTAAATITITAAPTVVSVTVNPTSATVQTGGTRSISATVQNDGQNKGVTWSLSGSGCSGSACGTLSATSSASGSSITYKAPGTVPSPATVTLTAKSVTDTSKSASATFTIVAVSSGSVTVSVSPKRAGLTTGQKQTFTASVSGSSTTSVTWEVDTVPGGNSSTGTIGSDGVYSPPSSPGTHTVGARSVADSTVSASATVSVTDLGGVYTYHNNLNRDGVNSKEYALNTSNVKSSTFGKRFACSIDAAAYAQPLWVANVSIGGGTHNVLIAATQHDTVYAFDADASPCHTYWSRSLLASGETWATAGDVGTDDITPDIGIVGTPVIDSSTKTIYVVSKSKNGGTFHQRLHALSLVDGSEKFSGPQEINFTSGGHTFNPLRQNERCGLALVNGVVYIAYASHGDQPTYYGWVVGYNASSLAQASVFNDNPNSAFGGIWMSGGAPAADSSNNLYVITGNGNFDGNTEFGDSFLKLSTGSGVHVSSFFTPSNESSLNGSDADLGAGGAAILVDQNSSPVPHLVIGGGKEGKLYLLNRDSLGGKNSTDSGAVQTFNVGNGIFATPAFWQNTLYLGLAFDHVKALAFDVPSGKFNTAPTSQSPGSFGFPGSTPSVSSQGSSNGIVWAIQKGGGAAILHAYDATNLATELWNSSNNSADQAGGAVKFNVPTIANGKVYVGTSREISVYGLSPN
ncbi:MAG: hypothetical protein M3P45_15365 [Acidobacteriota bacterium]|nr:hypothetical protein [Acidobacteriota bacterium]